MDMKVTLRKLDARGKAVKGVDGEDVINVLDEAHATRLVKSSKFWEIVDDPRESKGSPKKSRKVVEDEKVDEVESIDPIESTESDSE